MDWSVYAIPVIATEMIATRVIVVVVKRNRRTEGERRRGNGTEARMRTGVRMF